MTHDTEGALADVIDATRKARYHPSVKTFPSQSTSSDTVEQFDETE